jgi:hypothetical protein
LSLKTGQSGKGRVSRVTSSFFREFVTPQPVWRGVPSGGPGRWGRARLPSYLTGRPERQEGGLPGLAGCLEQGGDSTLKVVRRGPPDSRLAIRHLPGRRRARGKSGPGTRVCEPLGIMLSGSSRGGEELKSFAQSTQRAAERVLPRSGFRGVGDGFASLAYVTGRPKEAGGWNFAVFRDAWKDGKPTLRVGGGGSSDSRLAIGLSSGAFLCIMRANAVGPAETASAGPAAKRGSDWPVMPISGSRFGPCPASMKYRARLGWSPGIRNTNGGGRIRLYSTGDRQ